MVALHSTGRTGLPCITIGRITTVADAHVIVSPRGSASSREACVPLAAVTALEELPAIEQARKAKEEDDDDATVA